MAAGIILNEAKVVFHWLANQAPCQMLNRVQRIVWPAFTKSDPSSLENILVSNVLESSVFFV